MISMKIFTILITLVYLKDQLVSCDESTNYCYADDEHPYLLFNTKTAYHYTHDLIRNTSVPNCKPLQIWMIMRHGTRNPDSDEIKSMKHRLPDLRDSIIENHVKSERGSLCKKDLANLEEWRLKKHLKNHQKYLTEQGEEDLRSLAARFKNYFHELLQSDSADALAKKYKFRSTDTERTISSMKSFIKGLFGNVIINNTEVVPTSSDTLLRVYKTCKAWLNKTDSPSIDTEAETFVNSSRYDKIIHDVSKRLGFRDKLSLDDIVNMYTMCSFDKAWYVDKVSPWCAVFRKNELQVFEYENDLYSYYRFGYGRKINPKIGCPPLQDMFNRFSKLENGDASEPFGVFYFSHSTSLELLLTSMGIAEDATPLTASGFESMRNRKWDTSQLIPFAANLAAVFYKCDSSHKVRFYLNEVPLNYEGCEMGVCDWDYLKMKLGSTAFNCNVDFCKK